MAGRETAALIAAFDWGSTPLGPMQAWPQSLKTTVQIMLGSPVAMVLIAGPEGVLIYNDGYARIADRRHPQVLGMPVREAWPEVWDYNRGVLDKVMAGETVSLRDQMLVLERSGAPKAMYFDADYSPVPDESGRPMGALAILTETTERRADRVRLADERARLDAMFEGAPGFMCLLEGSEHRFVLANAASRRLTGGRDLIGRTVAEALPEVVGQGFVALLDQVVATGEALTMSAAPVELNTGPGGAAETLRLDFVFQPLRGEDGTVTGVFVEGHDITGLHAASEALRQGEARYRDLFDSIDEGFCVIEVLFDEGGRPCDYRFVEINPAFERQTGLGDALGRTMLDFAPDMEQHWFDIYGAVALTGEPTRFENRAEALGRWYDVYAFRVGDPEQRRVAVLFNDISERRASELALAEKAAELEAVFDAAPTAIWIARDPLAERIDGNAFSRRLLRTEAGANLSLSAGDGRPTGFRVLDRDGREIAPENLPVQRAARGEEVTDFEEEVAFEDGSSVFLVGNARPLLDASGEPRGAVAAFADISRRRAAEIALRDLNEQLEARVAEALAERKVLADIVEGTDAFVQVVGSDFRFLAINRASADEFERIFGVRPRVGDDMRVLLADQPESRAAVEAVWSRALTEDAFTETGEFGDPGRDRRFYEMRFNPLLNEQGGRIGAYQFVYDVTERMRAQSRLREAEQALHQSQKMETVGQLTGGVAHDFNNLLTPIVGALDMLQRRPGNDERAMRLIDGALTAADRAKTLVNRLLAFSRRQHLEPRAVDVAAVLDTLRDLIARSLGPGIDLRFRVQPDLPPAHVDPNQLELALLNLAVNARDAMGEEGTLSITADETGRGETRCVRIAVSDTGVGMDAETLARAVEPFFTTKEVGRGTGLGLSSVKGLAEQSGGEFSLRSEVGRGTTATLCLPVATGPVETAAAEADAEAVPAGRAVILLVDDEHGVRMGAADMLSEAGYTVVEATGPEEALAEVEAGLAFDLLVTDYAMPGMSGARLAAVLKERRPGLPVLLTTGYASMSEGEVEGLARLAKPFRQAELVAAVRAVLRR